jgi:uncharacterized protein YheU (UPF0270 family)
MRIPPEQLSEKALYAVVQEFVTRDDTDHSSVEQRIRSVLRELHAGNLALHFDDESQSCNVLPAGD